MSGLIKKEIAIEVLKNGGYLQKVLNSHDVYVYTKDNLYAGRIYYKTYVSLKDSTYSSYKRIENTDIEIIKMFDGKNNYDINLKTFLPNLDKLENEDLYCCMNLIQNEIKRRLK